MIVNGLALLSQAPIKNMLQEKVAHNGVTHGLTECGYDIRLKQEIRFAPPGPLKEFPGCTENKYGLAVAKYVDKDGRKYGYYNDSRFILASSIEEFQMPNHLMGVVHDKSTWARKGLSVFNTIIEPGWNGWLTLELVYHGKEDLIIPAGSGIAQVIFHDILEPASYKGKYQNQPDKPVSAINS